MNKLTILFCLLLANIAICGMDDSIENQSNALVNGKSTSQVPLQHNSNAAYIKTIYIPFMKTLDNMLTELAISLEEIPRIQELESYMAQDSFKDLMNFLGNCIAIERLDLENYRSEVIRESIQKSIIAQNYRLDVMIAMLNMIRYFDIECLLEPMLNATLDKLIIVFKTDANFVEKCLRSLSFDYQTMLKEKIILKYPALAWAALAQKINLIKVPNTFTTILDSKYFISYRLFDDKFEIVTNDRYQKHLYTIMLAQEPLLQLFNNNLLVLLLKNEIQIRCIKTGKLIREISLLEIQEITGNKNIKHIGAIYLDENLLAIQTSENIVVFNTSDVREIFCIINRTNDFINCNNPIGNFAISCTPDGTKVLIVEQNSHNTQELLIFDIITKQKTQKTFPGGTIVSIASDNFFLTLTTSSPAEYFNIIYTIDTLQYTAKEKKDTLEPCLLCPSNIVKYFNQSFVIHEVSTNQIKYIKPLPIHREAKVKIKISADKGIIIFEQIYPNEILDSYQEENVVLNLWPFVQENTLLQILTLIYPPIKPLSESLPNCTIS